MPDPPLVEQVASEIPVETAAPTVSGSSNRERCELGERSEPENGSGLRSIGSKFIEGPEDEALIKSLQKEPPPDWIDEHPGFWYK